MTESTPHPTDEQLSAAIDGLDADALAHAGSCARCGPRLALLREVAGHIGTAPAADDLLRERVIAAALDTPVDDAAAPGARGAGGGAGRRQPPLAWLAGAAAALLLVVVAGAVVLDRGDGRSSLTSGGSQESADDAQVAAGPPPQNLGSFSDAQQLAGAVAPLLGEDTIGPTREPTGGGAEADMQAPTTTTIFQAPFAVAAGPCSETVQREYGRGLGPLVYTAALTWQNQPAVLAAYRIEGATGPLDHRVFVLADGSCSLLTVFSL